MAELKWNKKQDRAITARGKGIVVSAAAGSGKTAVLVERIIRRICDETDGITFDKFLVVTFTRAAAREMNQRLRKKLDEKIAENPGNKYLLRQKRQLPLASISSIDSFLYSLVRENFHRLEITPDFGIVDPGEEKIMINEAFNETADDFYEKGSKPFEQLTDIIGKDKDDLTLFSIVKILNSYAESHISPDEWLDTVCLPYSDAHGVEESYFGKIILEHIADTARLALSYFEKGIEYVHGYEGLEVVEEELIDESASARTVLRLVEEKKWDELKSALENISGYFVTFKSRSVGKEYKNSDEIKIAKALRDRAKDLLTGMKGIIVADSAQYREDVERLNPVVCELVHFVREYRNCFAQKKQQRNVFGFEDITHLALKLLRNPDGSASDVALEIRDKFDEILIDEYQDTNEAQDAIFRLISKDCKNLFLVGDVKQSVYGFRLATPYMFIDKIKTWSVPDNGFAEYINLDKNYRSRGEVLECVNYLFRKTMSEKIGNIVYNGDEELKADYPFPDAGSKRVELDIVYKPRGGGYIGEDDFIARRVREILENETVYDKKLERYRRVRLRDICVLCRKNDTCANVAQKLNENGISAYHSARTGLFKRPEIITVFSLLQILDNPLQDIPLLNVLTSPIFGFSADELAEIRINKRNCKLYYAVRDAHDEKSRNFIERYNEFRGLSGVMGVSALLRYIYEQTGFCTVSGALTNGDFRRMNLMLLLDYASGYEENSTQGLSGFVRYLERCKQSEAEFETAAAVSESADVVNVMTIHKSKGLEFPIVIIEGAEKPRKKTGKTLAIEETAGVGLKICERKQFKTYDTVQHTAATLAKDVAECSEELRLLYVAMTRAMEKLIITAEVQSAVPDSLSKYSYMGLFEKLDPIEVLNTNSFFKLFVKSLITHPDLAGMRKEDDFDIDIDKNKKFDLTVNAVFEPIEETVKTENEKPQQAAADPELVGEIRSKVEYKYPYEALSKLVTKKSASSFNEDSVEAGRYFGLEVPRFAASGEMTGAQKGTATHRFMEVCDFLLAEKDVAAERDRLVAENLITSQQGAVLDIQAISKFFESDVFRRIKNSGKVYREQQFTVFVPADFVNPELGEAAKDEKILVQGVIDCAFVENGKTVVLDYKTDRVQTGDRLKELYHRQLEVYKIAAEESFGNGVSELLLYSFALGEEVEIR